MKSRCEYCDKKCTCAQSESPDLNKRVMELLTATLNVPR